MYLIYSLLFFPNRFRSIFRFLSSMYYYFDRDYLRISAFISLNAICNVKPVFESTFILRCKVCIYKLYAYRCPLGIAELLSSFSSQETIVTRFCWIYQFLNHGYKIENISCIFQQVFRAGPILAFNKSFPSWPFILNLIKVRLMQLLAFMYILISSLFSSGSTAIYTNKKHKWVFE